MPSLLAAMRMCYAEAKFPNLARQNPNPQRKAMAMSLEMCELCERYGEALPDESEKARICRVARQ
jgi:hypothetical protein